MRELLQKQKKKVYFIASLLFGILFTLLGGFKLLVYFGLAISFFIIGKKYTEIRQLYLDYKLGLRINSLAYSQKQTQDMQTKIAQYENDLKVASERLQLYKMSASAAPANLPNMPRSTGAKLPFEEEDVH